MSLASRLTELAQAVGADIKSLYADKVDRWNDTTTAVSKTIAAGERVSVTAPGQTITLPPSPSAGDEVIIAVGDFTDTIIDRNGETIRGKADNAIINRGNVAVHLFHDGSGWRPIA